VGRFRWCWVGCNQFVGLGVGVVSGDGRVRVGNVGCSC
jgi:hypothetical protein